MSNFQMKPVTRALVINESTTVADVIKNGNEVQKKVAYLFDVDGNGKYDEFEAKSFNKTNVSIYSNTAKLYRENELYDSVDISKKEESNKLYNEWLGQRTVQNAIEYEIYTEILN